MPHDEVKLLRQNLGALIKSLSSAFGQDAVSEEAYRSLMPRLLVCETIAANLPLAERQRQLATVGTACLIANVLTDADLMHLHRHVNFLIHERLVTYQEKIQKE